MIRYHGQSYEGSDDQMNHSLNRDTGSCKMLKLQTLIEG